MSTTETTTEKKVSEVSVSEIEVAVEPPLPNIPTFTKPHITDQPMTLANWWKHVDWFNVAFLVFMPIYAGYEAMSTPLVWKTGLVAVVYSCMTMTCIMAGYHRLWSHVSYRATTPLKIYLACIGAGAVQGTIRWWARDHRGHHRFTDTEKDPYSINKGFVYSHWGWLIMKQNPRRIGRTDISDLNEDWIVQFQGRHYLAMILIFGFGLPIAVCGLGWGDWKGGFVYAVMIRIWCCTQGSCSINSLAHWFGEQPFDDRQTSRDHFLTAILSFGEGYHNFHHEFPSDFRSAIEWWQYDPAKWAIKTWKYLGLAYDLKQFRASEIEKGRLQQKQKKLDQEVARRQGELDKKSSRLDWGKPLETLPVMEWDDYVEEANKPGGRKLIAVAGVIHDVTDFIDEHPGGKNFIKSGVGKDATAPFNGGIYFHTNAAHNVLSTMRVAVLRGGQEVEIWKRGPKQLQDGGNGAKIVRPNAHVTAVNVPRAVPLGKMAIVVPGSYVLIPMSLLLMSFVLFR